MSPLHHIQDQYKALNNLSIGCCIINVDFKVLFWNKYIESTTQVKSESILNHFLWDLFPVFEQNRYKTRVNQVFDCGTPVVFSSELHKKLFVNKEQTNASNSYKVSITPLRSDSNEIEYALLSVENISELTNRIQEARNLKNQALEEIKIRIETEKNLKDSEQKLQDLNKTKDKLFSIIAHDLKNPFNHILSFTKLLSENINNYNSSEIKFYLDSLHRNTQQGYNLLVNLLEWAQSQTGQIKYRPQKILLAEVLSENIQIQSPQAIAKEIDIKLQSCKSTHAYADMHMLNTILRNIISNAIKFSNRNSQILVDFERSSQNDTNYVKICIEDFGIGMNKDQLGKLFSLSYSTSTSGTENESGTGLGLLLCKEFTEINKGHIEVFSEDGKGTKFSIYIPEFIN